MLAGSGVPYEAVGMHRALESAIGLPSNPTSACSMLVLLMPPEVRRSFTGTPWLVVWTSCVLDETRRSGTNHRPDGAGRAQGRRDPLRQAALPTGGSRGEQLPVSLGDDLDGPIDHFDGRLVVDRVRRPRQAGGP